jgi:hypothetical protein
MTAHHGDLGLSLACDDRGSCPGCVRAVTLDLTVRCYKVARFSGRIDVAKFKVLILKAILFI